ncbi:hypothetical protein [Nostoc sp. 106C]|uniref:hypothetical protein n=1 Tax=Nostoc sp. 106C TaxID=1932667 RepID=UPI001412DDC1|nr:hypothetical protein [Nostoc sp. 106C]
MSANAEKLASEIITFAPNVLNGRIRDLDQIKLELQRILGVAYDVAAESIAPSLRIDA